MKKQHVIIVLALSLFAFSSCYKEGCMDANANNYDTEANTSDGSCSYSGRTVFWCTVPVSDSLINLGHTMLRFELEGEIIDSIATIGFRSNSGGCDVVGGKTFLEEFVGDTKRYYKYRVKGDGFTTIYEDFIEITSGGCTEVQLM